MLSENCYYCKDMLNTIRNIYDTIRSKLEARNFFTVTRKSDKINIINITVYCAGSTSTGFFLFRQELEQGMSKVFLHTGL
jgi:hypothetical protein